MNTYTDEERVEAIRRWWHNNGAAIIIGLILGVAGLIGWKYWVDYREARAENASQLYVAMLQASEQQNGLTELYARQLLDEYQRTPYAAMAAFELARQAVLVDDLSIATAHLQWILDHAKRPDTQQLARLRMARVMVASGEPHTALQLLTQEFDPSFRALVDEVRGDAYRSLGDIDQARKAYDQAIANSVGVAEFIQMKRDALKGHSVAAVSPVETDTLEHAIAEDEDKLHDVTSLVEDDSAASANED